MFVTNPISDFLDTAVNIEVVMIKFKFREGKIIIVTKFKSGAKLKSELSRSDHRVRSSLGISGFGDLGQDYKDGFRRGVVPRREIGHVRRHVTTRMTSEDYTSQT